MLKVCTARNFSTVGKSKKRNNRNRREYNKADENWASDWEKEAKNFKKGIKREKKIVKTVETIRGSIEATNNEEPTITTSIIAENSKVTRDGKKIVFTNKKEQLM